MHNQWGTKLYRVWIDMRQRCRNPKNAAFDSYGGRGITVCDEWDSFQKFFDWANKNGYNNTLQLDRIDNDGNYEPTNCRWADRGTQSANTKKIRKNNTSGYRGVTLKKGAIKKPWFAKIRVMKKNINLGYFRTAIEAAIAYDDYIDKHKLEHTKNELLGN